VVYDGKQKEKQERNKSGTDDSGYPGSHLYGGSTGNADLRGG
jgi:hypothetical protein